MPQKSGLFILASKDTFQTWVELLENILAVDNIAMSRLPDQSKNVLEKVAAIDQDQSILCIDFSQLEDVFDDRDWAKFFNQINNFNRIFVKFYCIPQKARVRQDSPASKVFEKEEGVSDEVLGILVRLHHLKNVPKKSAQRPLMTCPCGFTLYLDDRTFTLCKKKIEKPDRLTPRSFTILEHLMSNFNVVIANGSLEDNIDPEIRMKDRKTALSVGVSRLRAELGTARKHIENIPQSGYRFNRCS